MFNDNLTAEQAHAMFEQRGKLGWLYWRHPIRDKTGWAQVEATQYIKGRTYVTIRGQKFRASRIVWLMHMGGWPKGNIFKRNCIGGDDRFENLYVKFHDVADLV